MSGINAQLEALLGELPSLLASLETDEARVDALNALRLALHEAGTHQANPVDFVRWVPIDRVTANEYNPNAVAMNEMRLLYLSIKHDGYTQPIVTVWDPEQEKYVVVDGFHRYTTMRVNPDLLTANHGRVPIVVLNKSINDRMASTVRHNRARGKHSVAGMGNIVFSMLENGWEDHRICAELGLEPDELLRLKHVTGFSKLFDNVEYRRAWQHKRQVQLRQEYAAAHPDEPTPVSI